MTSGSFFSGLASFFSSTIMYGGGMYGLVEVLFIFYLLAYWVLVVYVLTEFFYVSI